MPYKSAPIGEKCRKSAPSLTSIDDSLHFLNDDFKTLIGSFVKEVSRNYFTDSYIVHYTISTSFQISDHFTIGCEHFFHEVRCVIKDVQNIFQIVAGIQVLNASIEEGFHFRSQEIWKGHQPYCNIIEFNRK